MKSKLIYLTVFFALIIIATFLKEVAFYVNGALHHFLHSLYVLPWIALVILIVFNVLKKIKGVKPWEFLVYSILGGFLLSIASFMLNETIGLDNSIEKNYVGIYGITTKYDYKTDSEVFIDHKTNVYNINDKRAKRALKRLENQYGDSSQEEFIFWQSAFANGFEPLYITNYKGTDSFGRMLTLFMTIGPLYLIETFIKIVMNSWILFSIPIIGLFFKRMIFGKPLQPIIEHFANLGKKASKNKNARVFV